MSYGGQQNRTEWYDRAPSIATYGYNVGSVAPHGATTRWTYTVPASRKAIIESVEASIERDSAAAGLGRAQVFVSFAGAYIVYVMMMNNSVYVQYQTSGSYQCVMLAGNAVSALTADGSSGGSIEYHCNMKATEYDA